MFHTVCLFRRLSLDEYRIIDSILPKFCHSFPIKQIPLENNPNKYVFAKYGFTHFRGLEGISMYLTKRKNYFDGFTDIKSYLHLIINPKVILNRDYISVANEIDGIFALHEVDKLFHRMGIHLTCADFKTARIDCCFNHQFLDKYGQPSDDMANDYLELLKRGKRPTGFELGVDYSESGRRFIPYKNSLVYTRNYCNQYNTLAKSVVINIYNKHEELKTKIEEMPYMFDSEEDTELLEGINYEYERDRGVTLNSAHGIIRFEVQLYYKRLYNITQSAKWGIETLNIYNFINDRFTEQVLLDYLGKISFAGNYFTYEEAKRLITEAPISCLEKTKENLLTLLAQVSRQRGWHKTITDFNKTQVALNGNIYFTLSTNAINRLLGWMENIGVNIVTIPVGWSSDFFYSPVNLISHAIEANAERYSYEIVPILTYDDFL